MRVGIRMSHGPDRSGRNGSFARSARENMGSGRGLPYLRRVPEECPTVRAVLAGIIRRAHVSD